MSEKQIEIHAPHFPESIQSGEIVRWNRKPGETFQRDEVLAEIETDKVILEVPAIDDGKLLEIYKPEGSEVVSDEKIALMVAQKYSGQSENQPQTSPENHPDKRQQAAKENTSSAVTPRHSSPSARKLATEKDIDIQQISPTGRRETVTRTDVEKQLQRDSESSATRSASQGITPGKTRKIPMSRLRSTIAKRLLDAQNHTAMLTTFNEVNLHAVQQLRKTYQSRFQERYGIKLGLMSFFVRACCLALEKVPQINTTSDEDHIYQHDFHDIGIAVSTERGLVVPILRSASSLSLAGIESNIADFAKRARENKLELEELQGGTFTITNGGVFGSMLSTPILNPPQSAILGMHSIQERPIVDNGQVIIRPMMYLALTYDHRVIDGREAVTFLKTIKEILENPGILWLEL
ncbi:MAG: 2-oxoglutarate dehydrogenase complex dihydrolipoyllysine-residue succinyltransferase [Gammaproteobacteria bacterium]|nr:MAG: 2-oxoglutarate dehydrogenase complex dihydrolipoyllysine-residue succinyltransferase [Gammaproteobacteria bacterium]